MMTLAQRLIHARRETGIQEPAEAANRAGITPSALYQLEEGRTKSLKGETAVRLGRVYPKFRIEWLIDGSLPVEHERTESAGETPPGYVRLRVMEGNASGGYGAVNEDFPEVVRELDIAEWQIRQQLGFVPSPDRVKLITVRGDSMVPVLKNGDIVMVDTARPFYEGDGLYLVNIHHHTFVKRLQMLTDGMHVISTNPNYRSELIHPGEIDRLTIGGRVLGVALMRSAEEV